MGRSTTWFSVTSSTRTVARSGPETIRGGRQVSKPESRHRSAQLTRAHSVDIHYSGTSDLEWYDPGEFLQAQPSEPPRLKRCSSTSDAITTKDGNLEITLTQEPIHNLNFRSGMLQSWNKFWCAPPSLHATRTR